MMKNEEVKVPNENIIGEKRSEMSIDPLKNQQLVKTNEPP